MVLCNIQLVILVVISRDSHVRMFHNLNRIHHWSIGQVLVVMPVLAVVLGDIVVVGTVELVFVLEVAFARVAMWVTPAPEFEAFVALAADDLIVMFSVRFSLLIASSSNLSWTKLLILTLQMEL